MNQAGLPGTGGLGPKRRPFELRSVPFLRLAREVDGKLVYAGKVGTGFTRKSGADVRKTLDKLARATSPVAGLREPKARWVEPHTEADVEYRELTEEGLVRQSSFRGLTPR